MNIRPVEQGIFQLPETPDGLPVLIGSRCTHCEEAFFPARAICARCMERCERTLLSQRGTLYTFTRIHQPVLGRIVEQSSLQMVGQVDLPEGTRIQTVLVGDPEAVRIGAEMEITLVPLYQDDEGVTVVSFGFRPVGV